MDDGMTTYTCSRCKTTTHDEEKMSKHILDKLCSQNAQFYYRQES